MLNASTPPPAPPLKVTPWGSNGKSGFGCGAGLLGGVCGPAAGEPPATGRSPEAAELAVGAHPATAAPTSSAATAAGASTVRLLPGENLADMMITSACRSVSYFAEPHQMRGPRKKR